MRRRGFELPLPYKERCAISETGTGSACALLSEILPAARVARFVRMTNCSRCSLRQDDELLASLAWSA
jgi:hypothetical protein